MKHDAELLKVIRGLAKTLVPNRKEHIVVYDSHRKITHYPDSIPLKNTGGLVFIMNRIKDWYTFTTDELTYIMNHDALGAVMATKSANFFIERPCAGWPDIGNSYADALLMEITSKDSDHKTRHNNIGALAKMWKSNYWWENQI